MVKKLIIRNQKIIIAVLVILLLGLLALYFISQSKSPPDEINVELTDAEKETIAEAMNEQLKNIPPITDKQKEDIAIKMMKSLSN